MDIEKWVKGVEHKIEALDIDTKEAKGILLNLEQSMTRPTGRAVDAQTMGSEFVATKGIDLAALSGHRGRVSMSTKATITTGASSGGALTEPHRDGVVSKARRRLTIRQLLTTVPIESGSVEYPEQTARNLNAGMQIETQAKPESEMAWELRNVPVRTIAHWIPASVQVLDDAAQLGALIDTELRYGVALKEEEQLVYGSGTGSNLTGMATKATTFAAPITIAGLNMLDMIGLGILQAALTDNEPDGIVIHPSDWWRMRLMKDADGKYLLGDPGANVTPVLFGLPIVPTQAMQIDKFLVGAFAAQTLYDRQQATVDVSTEHADFFTRNLVAIRCEERIGLAVKHPEALIYGDFGNVV